MKKNCKFISYLILTLTLTGCSNVTKTPPTSSSMQDLPSPTFDSYVTEEKCTEQDILQCIKPTKDNKISVQDIVQDLLHTSDKSYVIEDKRYKLDGHKGKFNVHYPVLKSVEKDMTVLNSVILARVVNELYYEYADTTIDIDLDYEIKHASDDLISILFTGFYNARTAAHPNNISYTINFDLKHNRPLNLYDVIIIEDNILEKVHGAMESQFDQEGVESYEQLSVQELYEQIYDKNEAFYMQDEKLYIRFSITAGSQHHEYISFTI